MPSWRKAASFTASLPTSAPVWAATTLAVSSVAPALSITMAFFFTAARRAAAAKVAVSRRVSANTMMTWVLSSSTRKSMQAATSSIASLPVAMHIDRPMLLSCAMSTISMLVAPLWPTSATLPGRKGGWMGIGVIAARIARLA